MKKKYIPVFCCLSALIACKEGPKNEQNKTDTTVITQSSDEVPSLKIVPIEHATAIIEWGDITIYIDPVGGAAAFKGQKRADLILITDIHGDHLSLETLEELDNGVAKIIAPRAVAELLPKEFTPLIDVLNNGESKERFGILVEAVPMYNLREEALNFHKKGRGNGYIINLGPQRLYFSGDTEDIPEMRELTNIDKAFICMNLPYTMTEESAADAVLQFKPRQVYPYHYRGRPNISDVNKFKALVNASDPEIEVVLLDWYPDKSY
ncbi:MBL fold metallo-hydrolase [Muriicola sp. Z0-33]|uniref:MBL fold metallo-hydrolase n=1 Tax=Muriicola sp. Z0-33 TaxID=2816957 RepID=UPI002238F772|nr:MBL fold metallo-hydrolase [Muriicola sp. Z0-33]MCW5516618.1 MBL fold metallo-hydrolase [Muriicola sp. Z0-33]